MISWSEASRNSWQRLYGQPGTNRIKEVKLSIPVELL